MRSQIKSNFVIFKFWLHKKDYNPHCCSAMVSGFISIKVTGLLLSISSRLDKMKNM